jgi:ParB family transcriptional regulator, chromosome partitioning protein
MNTKISKKDKPYAGNIDLARLFGSSSEESNTPEPSEIKNCLSIAQIHRKPEQVRRYFDPQKMEQLTASVREYGILENLLVRAMPGKPGEYELVAGERRYRAAQGAGLIEVPATILDLTDQQALQITLVENLQREDLNPVEETEGILQLLAVRLELSVPDVVSLLYRMQNESTRNLNHNVVVQEEESR